MAGVELDALQLVEVGARRLHELDRAVDLGRDNIRVNAISAGPIKTRAATGIGNCRYIQKWTEYNAPLRRTVTNGEVGGTAACLVTDMAASMTGEIRHVDAGYHVVGMKNPDAPDLTLD